MTIEHLVLCGGGPIGISMVGALKKLNQKNFWKLEDIKSIYACSIGTFIGVILCLDFEWSWVDDFFIKRPWIQLFNFDNVNYIEIFKNKGYLDEDYWIKCLKPLLLAKDMDVNITLKEFYEITNIEFHFFCTNVSSLDAENISYLNYPNMKLTTAVYFSSSVPIFCQPGFLNNTFFIDGGLVSNCPINYCLSEQDCHKDEILCFYNLPDETFYKFPKFTLTEEIDYSSINCSSINCSNTSDLSGSQVQVVGSNTSDLTGSQVQELVSNTSDLSGSQVQELVLNTIDLSDSHVEEVISNTNCSNTIDLSGSQVQELVSNTNCLNTSDLSGIKVEQVGSNTSSSNTESLFFSFQNNNISQNIDIFNFILYLLRKILFKFTNLSSNNMVRIKNSINVCLGDTPIDINFWLKILSTSENISKTLEYGEYKAIHFLNSL